MWFEVFPSPYLGPSLKLIKQSEVLEMLLKFPSPYLRPSLKCRRL